MSASYGSDVNLPCTVHSANPSPAYYWEKLPVEDGSSEINGRTLSDGSLLLQNVQEPGMYQCTAHNVYGSSTQITELSKLEYLYPHFCLALLLVVEMSTPTRQSSLDLVGAHLRSSCDQIEVRIASHYTCKYYSFKHLANCICFVIFIDSEALENLKLCRIIIQYYCLKYMLMS